MSGYMQKEYKLPNGRTVTADFNELGEARVTIEAMDYLMDMINSLVEVVRCKDCKYMTEHYDVDGNAPYWTCSEWDSGTDYDGFCSYGERR